MIDKKIVDGFCRLSQDLRDALPASFRDMGEDLDKTIREIVQSTLSRLDLVTREEFDVQTKVLLRTREKLEALAVQVKLLEEKQG